MAETVLPQPTKFLVDGSYWHYTEIISQDLLGISLLLDKQAAEE